MTDNYAGPEVANRWVDQFKARVPFKAHGFSESDSKSASRIRGRWPRAAFAHGPPCNPVHSGRGRLLYERNRAVPCTFFSLTLRCPAQAMLLKV